MTTQSQQYINQLFSLENQVAIVTGGTGVLGGAMAAGLARAGAKVAILGRRRELAESAVKKIIDAGGEAMSIPADVMNREQLEHASAQVLQRWDKIDILINAAGGTTPAATVPVDKTIFDMPLDAMRQVVDLNLIGTMLPSQVFGEAMARQREGCIVNISSMNVQRALTRNVAYAAGKAAAENFTKWLAIELATKFGERMRVNAIAPGFFVGDQNRSLLLNADNTLTARGKKIIEHTPAGRFGDPDDLVGPLVWLCSPAARFVTGTILMVDGGVNAFSGI